MNGFVTMSFVVVSSVTDVDIAVDQLSSLSSLLAYSAGAAHASLSSALSSS